MRLLTWTLLSKQWINKKDFFYSTHIVIQCVNECERAKDKWESLKGWCLSAVQWDMHEALRPESITHTSRWSEDSRVWVRVQEHVVADVGEMSVCHLRNTQIMTEPVITSPPYRNTGGGGGQTHCKNAF